jgi:hypothetical protein
MDDTDVYIDTDEFITSYLYDTEPIPDALLPPVFYVKRGEKRVKLEPPSIVSPLKKNHVSTTISNIVSAATATITATAPPNALASISTNIQSTSTSLGGVLAASTTVSSAKALKMENIILSRPLFDKPNTALIKLRRDIKMQKIKGWTNYKLDLIKSTLPIQHSDLTMHDQTDLAWLPNDDFIILHTLQVILELPLSLQVIAPGHNANWDLISDLVSSSFSHHYRSPSECKKRFETVILKREEMCLSEIQNKKQQQLQQQLQNQAATAGGGVGTGAAKGKQQAKPAPLNICKTKTLRTNQIFIQDNHKTLLHQTKRHFEKINQISKKKHPPTFSCVPVMNTSLTSLLGNTPLQNMKNYNQMSTPAANLNINYQHLMQQQQFDLFMSRFNTSINSNNMNYNTPGNYSSTVANAMNAVAAACKQQSTTDPNSMHALTVVMPESIVFKTPKSLAELKLYKERQSKVSAFF